MDPNKLPKIDRDLIKQIEVTRIQLLGLAQKARDRGIPIVFFCESTGGLKFWLKSIETHMDPDRKVPEVNYVKSNHVLRY